MRPILGVILAGGRATRLGGVNKALLPFGAGLMIDRVALRFRPQVTTVVLNSNADPDRLAGLGLTVLPDARPGFLGPLAGILAALDLARRGGFTAVASVPVDAPFLPEALVARLAAGDRDFALAAGAGPVGPRLHPTFGLWPLRLRDEIAAAVDRRERRLGDFAVSHGAAQVLFEAPPGAPDPFFSIDEPADIARAEAMRAKG